MPQDVEFTIDESIRAQKAMRAELDMPEEMFPVPAFVGMVSDEIDKLRAAGRSDDDIAAIVKEATGKDLPPEAIAKHYATEEERRALKD